MKQTKYKLFAVTLLNGKEYIVKSEQNKVTLQYAAKLASHWVLKQIFNLEWWEINGIKPVITNIRGIN